MTLALPLWLPLGALVISTGAFAAFLWLAWDMAEEGDKFHPRWGWLAHWALLSMIVCLFLTVLGAWWTVGPFG